MVGLNIPFDTLTGHFADDLPSQFLDWFTRYFLNFESFSENMWSNYGISVQCFHAKWLNRKYSKSGKIRLSSTEAFGHQNCQPPIDLGSSITFHCTRLFTYHHNYIVSHALHAQFSITLKYGNRIWRGKRAALVYI